MITAFLPCRAGSQRVPHKNTRMFAGNPDGLVGVKLRQLSECAEIDRIVLSTNDEAVIEIGTRFARECSKLEIDLRPDSLASSETSTDDLIEYASQLVEHGILLWTHVTSPMVEASHYSEMIASFRLAAEVRSHDSLMAVTPMRTFLWSSEGPLNYDRAVEKWPRTQFLPELFTINSAAFIVAVELMRSVHDRIGPRPLLFELDELVGFEIDWEEQFAIAELLFSAPR